MNEPSEAEVIIAGIEAALRGVHTALPGTIVSYVAATQTATVAPAVKLELAAGVHEDIPPIPEVPVLWPGGTGGSLHIPLVPGDGVLLLFFEQDPAPYLTGNPLLASKRRHGLFPVAIAGLRKTAAPLAPTAAPATALVLAGSGSAAIAIDATGIRLGSVAALDPVVIESKLRAALSTAATAAGFIATPAAGAPMTPVFNAFKSALTAAVIAALKVSAE
jgi:hypothetical protein